MKLINFEEAIIHEVKQLNNDGHHKSDYENTIPWKEKNCFNYLDCTEELFQLIRLHRGVKAEAIIKKSVPTVPADEGVSKMMCQLLKQQSAPDIDIDIFRGNPIDFYYFMTVFNEIVEMKVDDPRAKLTQLINYTTSDA